MHARTACGAGLEVRRLAVMSDEKGITAITRPFKNIQVVNWQVSRRSWSQCRTPFRCCGTSTRQTATCGIRPRSASWVSRLCGTRRSLEACRGKQERGMWGLSTATRRMPDSQIGSQGFRYSRRVSWGRHSRRGSSRASLAPRLAGQVSLRAKGDSTPLRTL